LGGKHHKKLVGPQAFDPAEKKNLKDLVLVIGSFMAQIFLALMEWPSQMNHLKSLPEY